MATNPNWGAGASAIGRAMMQYGQTKSRQDFIEEERRLREAQQVLMQQMREEGAAGRQQAAWDRQDAIRDEDNPLAFPEGIDMPFGANMPSDMRMKEAIQREQFDKLQNPQMTPYQEASLEISRDRETRLGQPRALTPYQEEMLGFAKARDDRAANPQMTPYQEASLEMRQNEVDGGDRVAARQAANYERSQADKEAQRRFEEYSQDLVPLFGDDKYMGAWTPNSDGTLTKEEGGVGPDWLYPDQTRTLSSVLAEGLAPKLKDGIDAVEYGVFKKIAKGRGVPMDDLFSEWAQTSKDHVQKIDGKWYVNIDGEWKTEE